MAGRSSDSESTIADIHAAPRATAQQPETDEKTVNGADGDVQRGHSSYASSSEPAHASSPLKTDVEAAPDVWDWDTDPANPWNWPAGKKWRQVLSISASAFAA